MEKSQRSKTAKKAVRRGKDWEREVAQDFEGTRKWWKGEDIETAEGLYIECKSRKAISPWLEKAVLETDVYGGDGIYIIGFLVVLDYERAIRIIRGEDKRVWILNFVPRAAPKYLLGFLQQAQRLARPGDPGIVALKRVARKPGERAFKAILMSRDDFNRFFVDGRE